MNRGPNLLSRKGNFIVSFVVSYKGLLMREISNVFLCSSYVDCYFYTLQYIDKFPMKLTDSRRAERSRHSNPLLTAIKKRLLTLLRPLPGPLAPFMSRLIFGDTHVSAFALSTFVDQRDGIMCIANATIDLLNENPTASSAVNVT